MEDTEPTLAPATRHSVLTLQAHSMSLVQLSPLYQPLPPPLSASQIKTHCLVPQLAQGFLVLVDLRGLSFNWSLSFSHSSASGMSSVDNISESPSTVDLDLPPTAVFMPLQARLTCVLLTCPELNSCHYL